MKSVLVSMYESTLEVEINSKRNPLSLEIVINGVSHEVDTSNMDFSDVIGHINSALEDAGMRRSSKSHILITGHEARSVLNYFEDNGMIER